jgi:hypothetical protein
MSKAILFPVSVEHKMGYIDAKGRVRIPPRFDFAHLFSDALALVGDWDPDRKTDPISRMWKAKYGFINPAGEFVVPPTFDQALNFKDGLAPVRVGKRWGFINAGGKVVIEPQFEHAEEFSEGLAVVRVKKEWQVLTRTEAWSLQSKQGRLPRVRTA